MAISIPRGQVDGEQLLDLDMKKFRQEKQEVCNNVTLTVTSTDAPMNIFLLSTLPVALYPH